MIPIYALIAALISLIGYPVTQSGVIFNHAAHYGERNIQCSECHTKAVQSSSAQDKLIPGHDVCGECHSVSDAPKDCKLCHTDPNNPSGVNRGPEELIFSHRSHIGDASSEICLSCHTGIDKIAGHPTMANLPTMDRCFECHDDVKADNDCKICHSRPVEMAKMIHPPDWEHKHRFEANIGTRNCEGCHQRETSCSECHAGDNLVQTVHDLNYRFNHGLDAKGKEFECQSCHDFESFCNSCHTAEGAFPLYHLAPDWNPRTNPARHGEQARRDIEACASCHQEEGRSTCAQPGCHWDGDGLRGTQPSIHDASITDFQHGPWHDDPNFQCFQCHFNTRHPGQGFCGYCHGEKGD